MKIKVCGITQIKQAEIIASLGADFVGFIGYKKSPRYAFDKLSLTEIAAFKACKKVGVFVDEDVEKVLQIVKDAQLDFVQLHGNEPIEKVRLLAKKISVIKALSVKKENTNLQQKINEYQPYVDYFLFDTATKAYGGSGIQFNWEVLNALNITKPYFLSGGIAPDTTIATEKFNQKPYALDINSKFESAAGVKNIEKVKQFLNQHK